MVASRLDLPPIGGIDSYNDASFVAKLEDILAAPDIRALTPAMTPSRIEKEVPLSSHEFFLHNWFGADFFHEVTADRPPNIGLK